MIETFHLPHANTVMLTNRLRLTILVEFFHILIIIIILPLFPLSLFLQIIQRTREKK